jgi:hypothetical protein
VPFCVESSRIAFRFRSDAVDVEDTRAAAAVERLHDHLAAERLHERLQARAVGADEALRYQRRKVERVEASRWRREARAGRS